MPAWLISAMQSIRTLAFGTPLRSALTGTSIGLAADDLPGVLTSGALPGLGLPFGGGGGGSRRRRRRRALTKSDMADLAFLGTVMSKSGVERIAALIVAKA